VDYSMIFRHQKADVALLSKDLKEGYAQRALW